MAVPEQEIDDGTKGTSHDKNIAQDYSNDKHEETLLPSAEDTESQLTDECRDMLGSTFSLMDEDDEENVKRIPGSIVPLGVRADRGKGPLASAAASVKEIDDVLSDLEQWKSEHESQVRSIKLKYENQLDSIYSSDGHNEESHGGDEVTREFEEEDRQLRAMLRKFAESTGRTCDGGGGGVQKDKAEIVGMSNYSLSDAELYLLKSSDLSHARSTGDVTSTSCQKEQKATYDAQALYGSFPDVFEQNEEELQLDGIEDNIVEWNAQMDSVLAKMDALSA